MWHWALEFANAKRELPLAAFAIGSAVLDIDCCKPLGVRRIAGEMPVKIASAIFPPDRPPLAELPLGSIDPDPRLLLPCYVPCALG